ncbi:hypothetical protein BOM23_17805 [Erwinia sp. OLMDLW33]|nr:hypothetical protein BOM23_17805 [Erwinia sp. OLMDLW33]
MVALIIHWASLFMGIHIHVILAQVVVESNHRLNQPVVQLKIFSLIMVRLSVVSLMVRILAYNKR